MDNLGKKEDLIDQLIDWSAQASPIHYRQNKFGKYVREFCEDAEKDCNSFESEILSRIDTLLFGKYAMRRMYINQYYLPPFTEFSVDTFYNYVGLGISPKEREILDKKFVDTFGDIMNPDGWNFDNYDLDDEIWDIFD